MVSKSQLAIILSKLKLFTTHSLHLEQYGTPSEIAADLLWQVDFSDRNIAGKVVCDLGCGTGILGIGALILGAKKVFFVDTDEEAISVLLENIRTVEKQEGIKYSYEIVKGDVQNMTPIQAEVVVCNPPFGTKAKHADREFLGFATKCAPYVYSFHKTVTLDYLKDWCDAKNFDMIIITNYNFELKATQEFHTRKIHRIEVSSIRIKKY